MMNGNDIANFIVIDNGILKSYSLNNKSIWMIGRSVEGNNIKTMSKFMSRRHGALQKTDGLWFYLDNNGTNGTYLNGKRIKSGLGGRIRPTMINVGDILVFGCGDDLYGSKDAVWGYVLEAGYEGPWNVEITKDCNTIAVTDDVGAYEYANLTKGMTIRMNGGMVIYMEDLTYYCGTVVVKGY